LGEEARSRVGPIPDRAVLLAAARDVIDQHGYESRTDGDRLLLANCPFHALAEEHRDLVCGMNLDLLSGLLDGLKAPGVEARLEPAPGRCCVALGNA
jgi:predicted ArsR family transcriptional regulator